jgi:hypothetical protein
MDGEGNEPIDVLFVKNGTMFTDWLDWKTLINNYPHSGFIAHLIWKPGQMPYINDQCWFMNIDKFNIDDFTVSTVCHPEPVRSKQNLHDDYTPLWIGPGNKSTTYTVNNFGQGLIAKHLSNNQYIVNWNDSSRDIKFFLYTDVSALDKYKEYIDLSENQLWIFNNGPIQVIDAAKIVCPGSGLFWLLNIVNNNTEEIQIVDISKVQLNFCRQLWNTWNGVNYANFVWNFIIEHDIRHYQFDDPSMTALEKLQLKKKANFIEITLKYDKVVH